MSTEPDRSSSSSFIRLVASNPSNRQLKFYRGISLDKMEPAEIEAALLSADGQPRLRSVIDIRTKEEIGDCSTYPLPEGIEYRVLQLTSSGQFAELRPAADPQVTFYRIDFYTLTKKLRIFAGLLWNNWRLALTGWRTERFDTSDGYKMGVLKKLSSDVAHSKGPAGMYLDWLEPSMDCSGLVALFRLLSDSDIYPAMLHCQYGKDRTGAVCALLQLMDPSLTEEQVVDAYHETEKHIERFMPEIERKVKRAGMPLECARCPKELIREVIAWLKSSYGTVENYLQQIGLDESEVSKLKSVMGFDEKLHTEE